MEIISATPPEIGFTISKNSVLFRCEATSYEKEDISTGKIQILYEYDEYILPVKNTKNLKAVINADYDVWLEKAKKYEFDTEAKKVRTKRDNLLNECDVVYCNPEKWDAMNENEKNLWRTYKEDLREVPNQENFPYKVIWPQKPQE